MVRFKTLSRDEAKRIISAFDNYDDVEFDDLVNHWEQYDPVSEYDESFVDFRKIQTMHKNISSLEIPFLFRLSRRWQILC